MKLICDKCKRLCKFAKINCIGGSGNKKADIMFIGEAPEEDEDNTGSPFVGPAGKYLRRHLFLPSGIDENDVYIDNAIKCRLPKNKKPSVNEMRNCREHIFKVIREVNPKVIVPLGNVPMYSILYLDSVKSEEKDDKKSGMSGITKWRGKLIWHKDFNCYVIPTFHPSGLMRNKRMGRIYPTTQAIEDLELAYKIAGMKRPVIKYPVTEHIKTKKAAIDILKYMCEKPIFAVDTETEDFDWWKTPLYGMSLAADRDYGYYLDFQILDIGDSDIRKYIALLLSNGALKLMHNSTFDVKVFHTQRFTVRGGLFDTMLAAHLIDENFYKGLKPLTWRYLKFGGYEYPLDQYRRNNKLTKSFKGIPGEVLAPYAAYDSVATLQLYKLLLPKLEEEKLFTLKKSILIPARKVFTSVEINGIRVDKEKALTLGKIMIRLEKGLIEKIHKIAGYEFNLKSSPQKQELFFKKFKMIPLKETASSTINKPLYSTDGKTLKYLITQGGVGAKIAELLLDYSYLTKQHSTFVNAIINNAREHGNDGYFMHTNYNMTGTVTLRLSCYNPCTHNIPNDGMIKALYIPRKGRIFCYADIKAAEMRVLAVYTEEPQLIKAFKEGRDVHTEVWRLMFDKKPEDKPTDEERRDIKRIVFGLIYGMGVKSLAQRIGKSIDVAADYVDRFFDRLPNARKFFERTYRELESKGYIRTLVNSKRRLPVIFGDDDEAIGKAKRQAVNTKIQTVAAVFTFIGLNRINKAIRKIGLRTLIVHSIHDCVICDTPLNEVKSIKQIITTSFEKKIKILPIKMEVDVECFNNWGQDCDKSRIGDIIKTVKLKLSEEEKELFKEWV